jgi:trans-2,3-dihydro-3-hydroxyanthranilic acid synthase
LGIPPIRPYPMPTAADLPPNVASWRPDPTRALLLIHDMQRYFVDMFPPGQSPRVELLAHVDRIRRAANRMRIPVVYTAQPGRMSRQQRGLLFDLWGPGMSTDPAVQEITAEVGPGPDDLLVVKHRYSAFHHSRLDRVRQTHQRDQLVVCGVYAHVGCLTTAVDAFTRDIETFLVADAVADFTARDHRMALDYARRTCAVVLTTDQLLAALCPEVAVAAGQLGPPTGLLLDDPGQLHP